MTKILHQEQDLDALTAWIDDDSKTLTKKQKAKLNKTKSQTAFEKDEKKKTKWSRKKQLNKYNREKNPMYGKTRNEQIVISNEYKEMLKNEKEMKEKRMKEIRDVIDNPEMTNEQKQEFLNALLNSGNIEISKEEEK